MPYLSKYEVTKLVKSGLMAFPLEGGGHATPPVGKSTLPKPVAVPATPVSTTNEDVNAKLEEVARAIEVDRNANVDQFPPGSGVTPGLVAGYNRAITIVRANKL